MHILHVFIGLSWWCAMKGIASLETIEALHLPHTSHAEIPGDCFGSEA